MPSQDFKINIIVAGFDKQRNLKTMTILETLIKMGFKKFLCFEIFCSG